MIRRMLFSAVAVVAGTSMVAVAAPKDEVSEAAKKLAGAPNYSWKSNTERAGGGGGGGGGRGFGGPAEGKAEKDVAHITTTRGDNTVEIVRKGDKVAVKTPEGWRSGEELRQAFGGGGGGQGRGGFGMMGRMVPVPAQQAQDLVAKTKEIKKSGDAYEAELTEEGVRELLMPGRRGGGDAADGPPAPTNMKGTAKFWVKEGTLAKYEYNVKGTVNFNGEDRDIDRTTTVEIKDVGSTKVEVPSEAKAKLE